MNKEKEYHIEIYEDSGKQYVLLEDLKVVLEAGQERQQRIDKAIEYINNHALNFNNEIETDLQVEEVKELVNILRGEE